MTNYLFDLEKHSFNAERDGPHLVVTARIHGNEPSGEKAARQLIGELHKGEIRLKRGFLTIFPVLNPLAKEANVRGIWIDANREITRFGEPFDTPEHQLRRAIVNDLYQIGRQHKQTSKTPWNLLDLHSVPLPGEAHTITSDRKSDLYFARAIGAPTIYDGWRKAQLQADDADLKALGYTRGEHFKFTSALIYGAQEFGVQTAVCLESGQDDHPDSVKTAYAGIRRALHYHSLVQEPYLPREVVKKPRRITFDKVLIRRDDSEELVGIEKDA